MNNQEPEKWWETALATVGFVLMLAGMLSLLFIFAPLQ